MGDGLAGKTAGDNTAKTGKAPDSFDLSKSVLASITAEVYGHAAQPKAPSHDSPIKVAQATVGTDGTYGAPALGSTDSVVRPPANTTRASDKPYDFGNSDARAANSDFKPVPYDTYKEVGGSPFQNLPDYGLRILGTGIAARVSYNHFGPEMNKGLDFRAPSFSQENGVQASTIDDFAHTRISAHAFMKVETSRLQKMAKGISVDPQLRTDSEQHLVDRLVLAKSLKDQTTVIALDRDNPVRKIDFGALEGDSRLQRGFEHITNFEKAQDNLIGERSEFVKKLKEDAVATHKSEVRAATLGFASEVAALAGAQVANIGIDYITPRNRISWITSAVDLAAPIAAIAAPMTSAGKWAPLIKAGIIIGAHTASHLTFDQQVDESK